MTTLQKSVTDKDLSCRKLKEQLDALEKEMTAKLGDMDQYKKDIQVNSLSPELVFQIKQHLGKVVVM